MGIDFESLFRLSPNPYVVLDSELKIVWMNEAYLRATMQKREAITGRAMFDAFPSEPGSDSHELLSASLQLVLTTAQPDEIALIRYDIPEPGGSMAQRFWSATHTPLLDNRGEVEFILQHTVDVTELHRLRRMRDEVGLLRRADAVQSRNLDLRAESERLNRLFEQAPGFAAVLKGGEHVFEMANQAYRRLIGRDDIVGKAVTAALPEVVEQGFVELLDTVMRTGQPYFGRGEKILLDMGNRTEERFLDFIYQPIFEVGDEVSGVFVQGHDVTEEVTALRHQELLINELNHRVKNTLAIVQGLAAQSFRGLDPTGVARDAFAARLRALAAAHDLLTERRWEPASLGALLRSTIKAATGADSDRFDLAGPEIAVPPQMALAIAMAVHELCTNAIKYGALSNAIGRIGLDWHEVAGEGDTLQLDQMFA